MRSVLMSSLTAMAIGFGILVTGCSRSESSGSPRPAAPSAQPSPPSAQAPAPSEPKKAEADNAALPEGLTELPEADRALAVKQKICPVSDEPLGSMGKPVKVEVKGRTVFLCCDSCVADLKKEPDKFLAKLDAKEVSRGQSR